MESLFIKPTADTPKVAFESTGELTMEGRSLPENPNIFYDPLLKWAGQCTLPVIIFNLRLEYFNTASSKLIFNLLKRFIENASVKEIRVKWHYETGDLDSLEMGQQYQSILKIPFEYIEVAESEF
jgi:SiaC family regulatory phosphoprotein